MDIQNLTSVPVVVINSLLTLLKANHIDINSVVMQLSSDKDEDINLGELTQQTLNELQKAKAQKVAVPNKIEIEVKAHNLDCQIDELKSRIIEKNFMSNESEDQLEDLIAKAMVLGELYAKRDGVAVVVPDGFVLMPKEATQEIYRSFQDGFNNANGGNTAQNFKAGYKAMIEAQEQVG